MADRKVVRGLPNGSSTKENRPPSNMKRTISISSLFDQTDRLRKKNEESSVNVLGPRPTGVSKPRVATQGFFKKFAKPKPKDHPLYSTFKEVVEDYNNAASATEVEGLQPVYESLVARVDGLDIRGQPLNIPGVVTQADINTLVAVDHDLFRSLEEEILQIEDPRTGQLSDVRPGDTLQDYEKVSQRKHADLMEFLKQLTDVNAEILTAKAEVVNVEKTEVMQAKKELFVQLKSLKKQALANKRQTETEVNEAYAEDREAKEAWERKVAMLNE